MKERNWVGDKKVLVILAILARPGIFYAGFYPIEITRFGDNLTGSEASLFGSDSVFRLLV